MDAPEPAPTRLARKLMERIALEGPITAADYMTACLRDPDHGYYATHPALGADGDFVTAPLVSQMFGELVGAWLAETWMRLGRPSPVRLVELGPGDGTMMADVLRVLAHAPDLLAHAELWLVEPSAPLRARQAERAFALAPQWVDRLAQVPGGAPLLLVANEVLDCLPARQFLRQGGRWAERRIGLGAHGRLAVGLAFPPADFEPPDGLAEAPDGVVIERCDAQAALGAEIGDRVARDGGAALLIDYGRDRPAPGDTLQALSAHRKVDPLAAPGEADLTVHVDFQAVARAAQMAGAATSAIVAQGELLNRLGIDHRVAALSRARPDRADRLAREHARLTAPDAMGVLFKALALHQHGLIAPGFEEPA